ncbi:unnamed protein product [Citrullus colocynthis]|uniref:Uncharacterized protein n=1 Tax=Citrullus colocynthis TaxID=252529 RepID=A0ABP0Z5G8_9ROSI
MATTVEEFWASATTVVANDRCNSGNDDKIYPKTATVVTDVYVGATAATADARSGRLLRE